MYLLRQDFLKNIVWEVKDVEYNHLKQEIKFIVNTTTGKSGAKLPKLKRTVPGLSEHLYKSGLTFRKVAIKFSLEKEQEEIQRIYNLMEKVV